MDSQPAATPPPGGASSDPGPAPEAEVDQSTYASVFLATFSTVFLAELGDKTQLAALLLSAESGRPVIVFFGASLALICSSLVGVLLGRWLSTVMAPEQLERAAGVLMVALGLWLGRQAVLNLAPLHLLEPGGLASLIR
jgi:putative Ca2+/H+ antiporter (TMEM165/GDT1 family)